MNNLPKHLGAGPNAAALTFLAFEASTWPRVCRTIRRRFRFSPVVGFCCFGAGFSETERWNERNGGTFFKQLCSYPGLANQKCQVFWVRDQTSALTMNRLSSQLVKFEVSANGTFRTLHTLPRRRRSSLFEKNGDGETMWLEAL